MKKSSGAKRHSSGRRTPRARGKGSLGFVVSPVGAAVLPRTQDLFKGVDLLWSELGHILSYLSAAEIYRTIGCSCRVGFVVFQRESHSRRRDVDRDCARFLSRKEITTRRVVSDVTEKRVHSMRDRVLLSSYPRSGNSFLRSLLEKHTGIITGSDCRPNRNLSASLLRFGFQGEGIIDESVWVVKSHYPERYGFLSFSVGRVVLLVRNPFDAIESYFHMAFTNTHDKVLHPSVRVDPSPLAAIWDDFVLEEIKVWIRYHNWWKDQASKVPVLVTRFEDLREQGEVERILAFAESDKASLHARDNVFASLSGDNGSVKMDLEGEGDGSPSTSTSASTSSAAAAAAAGPGYRLKSGTLQVGKSLAFMSSALLDSARELLQPYLLEFGYSLTQSSSGGEWSLQVLPLPCDYLSHFSASSSYSSGTDSANDLAVNSARDRSGLRIRGMEDKYGRNVTPLRHSMTNNDKQPFALSN